MAQPVQHQGEPGVVPAGTEPAGEHRRRMRRSATVDGRAELPRMAGGAELSQLTVGEHIEARHIRAEHYAGRVEVIAPDLGVLWIHEAVLGERKLLQASEYSFRRTGGCGRGG